MLTDDGDGHQNDRPVAGRVYLGTSNLDMSKTFASLFKESCAEVVSPIPIRPITYLHREPQIVWKEVEVVLMIHKEKLQYAILGKFSYVMLGIKELRRIIPT